MPRIDPIQLLKCLSVLLSPTGGIKSKDEQQTLVKLMTRYSKKLVSKCIYIQILKCTETELLGIFMGSGGWRLVHMWLTESIVSQNWPLVRELLELLLLCPVDVDRLKTNNCPKLVKELSKDGNHLAIRALASKLVDQWLKTVKGDAVDQISLSDIPKIIAEAKENSETVICKTEPTSQANNADNTEIKHIKSEVQDLKKENSSSDHEIENTKLNVKIKKEENDDADDKETLPILKITLKDGKQILSQVEDNTKEDTKSIKSEKSKSRHRSSSGKRSPSKSSSSKHSSKSSSSDKHRSSSSSSHKKDGSPSRHKSRDKDKDREKQKHSSHSSSKSSSRHSESSSRKSSDKSSSSSHKSSKDSKSSKSSSETSKDKSKESEKSNKETVALKTEKNDGPPSIQKLGKIPKLSDQKRDKPSISIEVRKPDEPKPKIVKTFQSKFRKHGLEEEIKPPPSRAAILNKKTPPPLPPTLPTPKRPMPVQSETPLEKKAKIVEPIEKPGSIKLIPPKPKPVMLLESDMFMDALNASATNKKEPKKRKRRTSGSKDGTSESSPPHTSNTVSSPTSDSKSVPPRFYQDTLDTEEDKDRSSDSNDENNDKAAEISEPHTLTVNGLKGVLCYHKRKGPKKSIKWKPDSELEEVQYFELDETERVNVTKTFTDMKHLERVHEREAFEKARNLLNDDVMEEKTSWKQLIPIDCPGQIAVEYGKNSKEKEIQAIRQKGTLQPLYFNKAMIPDSPAEPDLETHPYCDPTVIPLEDVTGNQDNISDFRNMPWPEPKGNAPAVSSSGPNVQNMFPNNIQFANSFPNPQFPGMPGFQAPGMMPGDWPNGMPPMMGGMPGAPGPMPGMPPPVMPPGLMVPPDGMMMPPDMFGAPNPMFPPGPPEGFNMMDNMMNPNMFPPDFDMGGQGPGPFPGGGGFRGNMRGRGAGGPGAQWRGKAPTGRGSHNRGGRKTVCIYFQRKGSCRQGDNCTFLHPGVNCPY